MDEDDSLDIPRILFKVYTPLSRDQYEIILDVGNYDVIYYTSLAKLLEREGVDSEYTVDFLPLYEDLYAN
jgi:hypothetical protein